jgi:hypothetical protein
MAQSKAKVSLADARRAARAVENGKVKRAEPEKKKGKPIDSLDIQMPDGLHEVNMGAVTGKVVEDTIENAEDEAAEAAQGRLRRQRRGLEQSPATDAHPQKAWNRDCPKPNREAL